MPLTVNNLEPAQQMVSAWYEKRIAEDPEGEYTLEQVAMERAFKRKAKLSYQPHHFEEKYWACLREDLHGENCAEEALD